MTLLSEPPLYEAGHRPHRWTLEAYDRAAEVGLFEGRTELIHGEIFDTTADGDPHRIAVSNLLRALFEAFPADTYLVTGQPTARLDSHNAPSPDGMVEEKPTLTPGSNVLVKPLLVVEVSDSSLLFDQITKASLYASQGVRDFWIVNLQDRCLQVMRRPVKDESRKFGWRYAEIQTFQPSAVVSPLANANVRIQVAKLLP